ncbi:uncharacterized protein BJ212DRAFT_1549110 [Suillus subaureus]|uniref:Cullin neddylation domain-containing protein n=1 Tax=Suillus subaureus TaxID=48587 RepID=A0A9P7J5H1_9AGAM|nr:uncharacterized protein BJ212DRAFT_1549110 [Suillus subaureus]KAG1803991.1 hypothetical protein BJ212DRAFT_1549110 [Suillus subaureus]
MSSPSQDTRGVSEYSQSSGLHADGSFFDKFPLKWNVPKSFISRHIFKICCLIFTWRSDLQWLHALLKEGNNWEELHRQYLTQLNQQGLVLATAAVFISSNPPLVTEVDYTSHVSYACLAESLVFSLFGLLLQLKVSASGILFQKRSAAEVRIVHCQGGRSELTSPQIIIERRWRIFWHLLGLAVPIITFTISVVLLLIVVKDLKERANLEYWYWIQRFREGTSPTAKTRISLNRSIKAEVEAESSELPRTVKTDRKHAHQATSVRIMKACKTLRIQPLIQEVVIDELLDKEYIQRVDGTTDASEYVA